ncbi:MAG: enoyl-CoA hydratase-related protein, partial [Ferruginibacter sp.]|uniref:enoyl-CoA hydratase-related protein n=1 Tax=Flavobacterium sp. TaxID=239 RepID=UPI003266474A
MGMIYKVFADDIFEMESKKIAETLAALPTKGLTYTKQALNNSLQNNLFEQLKLEDALQYKAAHTEDYNEGVAAFIEKRKAVFKGK